VTIVAEVEGLAWQVGIATVVVVVGACRVMLANVEDRPAGEGAAVMTLSVAAYKEAPQWIAIESEIPQATSRT
jgi:hypothetical protein